MRPPRRSELAILTALLDGPKPIREGPIGRCVKRGWCAVRMETQAGTGGGKIVVLYELTSDGHDLLAEAAATTSSA